MEGFTFADFFRAAEDDKALQIIGDIVGSIPGIINGSPSPLPNMFLVLNAAIFLAAVLLLCYQISVGITGAAWKGDLKEGETWWFPLRVTWGIAGLVPIFAGYSMPQVIVIVCAIFSVGTANLTWQAAHHRIVGHVDNMVISDHQANPQMEALEMLLQAQICAASHNQEESVIEQESGKPPIYFVRQTQEVDNSFHLTYGPEPGPHGLPPASCGGISVPLRDPAGPSSGGGGIFGGSIVDGAAVAQARKAALVQLSDWLWPWAEGFATTHHPGPTKAEMEQFRIAYMAEITNNLAGVVLSAEHELGQWMNRYGQSFFYAGAIFPKLMTVNREIMAAAMIEHQAVPAGLHPANNPEDPNRTGVQRGFNKFMGWASSIKDRIKDIASFELPSLASFFERPAYEKMHSTLDSLLRGETNLLHGMVGMGHTILTGSITIFFTTMAALAVVDFAGLNASVAWLLASLAGLLLPMMGAGVVFAFYLPVLPAIIWYGGLLAWGIVLLEALIAAPLWMMAHLETKGEGMGHRTAHGYIFLLNVLFRPALMVFGLVAGWLMMNLFGSVLREIMAILYGAGGAGFGGVSSIIMFAAIIVIFAYLAMMTINRSFSLIHHLPNEVISWVGGHLRGLGGGETEGGERKLTMVGGVVATGMGKQLEGMGRQTGGSPKKQSKKPKEEE